MSSSLKISALHTMAARATKNYFVLPEQSFMVKGVDIHLESEEVDIAIHLWMGTLSVSVKDKVVSQSVDIDFYNDGTGQLFVCFWKTKRTWQFWKKPEYTIAKSKSFDLFEMEENEYLQFIWDRIPEYLL